MNTPAPGKCSLRQPEQPASARAAFPGAAVLVQPIRPPRPGEATWRLCVLFSVAVMLCSLTTGALAAGAPAGMVQMPAGVYRPLLRSGTDPERVAVNSFYLDIEPVSNADFLEFVRANPRWRRSQVKRIFADESYLANWAGDLEPGAKAPANAAVTYVSWFAAEAYAHWKGRRLPTIAEWEFAAAASGTEADGNNDPAFKAEVLQWYANSAATEYRPLGGRPNFYGVRDLHGLIWEWAADFNSALPADDGADSRLFCGAGAQNARDVDDYPAFMRCAFRTSLRANYCIHNLGFRCAQNL